MNLRKFETELDQALTENDTTSELTQLSQKLTLASQSEGRSSQQQQWAWTRLSVQMKETSKPSVLGLFSLTASLVVVGVLIVNQFFLKESEKNNGDRIVTLSVANPAKENAEKKLVATSAQEPKESARVLRSNPHIYTTPFFSEDANAEVIWATGYDYLPSTYKVE